MTGHNTAPDAASHRGIWSSISPAAIIVAALAASTAAVIRPIVEASTPNAVLVAMFLSVATTTSTAIYKAGVEKITNGYRGRTNGYRGRKWRQVLFAGLLAGLVACLLGIGVASGAELAIYDKTPSILPNGTSIIPYLVSGTEETTPALTSYYYDSDGDKVGSGNPEKHKQGSQRPGWVEKSGDKCPDSPGPPENDGCPLPDGPLILYFSDHDFDGIGDTIGPGSPTQYKRGFQPNGWVERNGDNCPSVFNPDQKNIDGDVQGDACDVAPNR